MTNSEWFGEVATLAAQHHLGAETMNDADLPRCCERCGASFTHVDGETWDSLEAAGRHDAYYCPACFLDLGNVTSACWDNPNVEPSDSHVMRSVYHRVTMTIGTGILFREDLSRITPDIAPIGRIIEAMRIMSRAGLFKERKHVGFFTVLSWERLPDPALDPLLKERIDALSLHVSDTELKGAVTAALGTGAEWMDMRDILKAIDRQDINADMVRHALADMVKAGKVKSLEQRSYLVFTLWRLA